MPSRTPRTIARFCKTVLPLLHKHADGRRNLNDVAAIVETDRWNSFDRFHQTTQTLVQRYTDAGAVAEVYPIQTGGRIGSGRWIIHEAADVRSATVDIIRPGRQRVLDFKENPWHVIQWSGSTPRNGMVNELVVLDDPQELERMPPGKLAEKMVLTQIDPRSRLRQFGETGAAGVIHDRPVPHLPGATAWTKFGWGGIPIENAPFHLVGLVLSGNEGKKLRKLLQKHGSLTLRTKVDIRKYVGAHDMVSGIVKGRDDPQDEVWVLAHSAEPGALDNASGVALCLEIARIIEGLVAGGLLPRPRRSIRLLNAYECHGFFKYLEDVRRLQTPLAGTVIDTVGSKPSVCNGRLEWHATIPMSAGFVDRVGEAIIRAALRLNNPGYKLYIEPFQSTSDTLIGDPKYGFPCPWLTTHHRDVSTASYAYHTSADTLDLVSPRGLATCATAMAGYLYYLADAGSREVVDLATAETRSTLGSLQRQHKKISEAQAAYIRERHHVSLQKLQRWMWGGDHSTILSHLSDCERQVREAAEKAGRNAKRARKPRVPGASRIPRRTAPLSPIPENTPSAIYTRIGKARLSPWALFWADGNRTISEIAQALSCETGQNITLERVITFFEAHAELEYVNLFEQKEMISKARLIADLKALGVERGMDVMAHSSLSAIGHVIGGPHTVIDALLSVIGKKGTLMMPSFNHGGAEVYNPLATPTTNGTIPDAFWRRPEAVRSLQSTHPVAAVGPGAEAYCQDHLENGIWAPDSPIGRLVHGGGYILSLGVDHNATTAYHIAEIELPCGCIDAFGNTDRIVMPDGSVREVPGLAWRSQICPIPPGKLNTTLDRRKRQVHGRVGNAPSTLVKAIDVWKARTDHLKNVCPTCTIKPGIRT